MRIGVSPKPTKRSQVDNREFERFVSDHEAHVAGKGASRVLPRFIVAQGMDADGRNLAEIDFTGSDLTGTSFVGADLRGANFRDANLSRCDLRDAVLKGADLRGSRFAGAKLSGAVMDGADLRAATLCLTDENNNLLKTPLGAQITGVKLDGALLDEAMAFGIDFSNCSLRGAKLRHANLRHALFIDANLDGAELQGARLGGARFDGAILTGVNVARLGLPPASLKGCVMDVGAAAKARLAEILEQIERAGLWVRSGGEGGAPAVLDGMDLRPAKGEFAKRPLAASSMRGVTAVGVSFAGSVLVAANFEGADLRGADFTGADLRGASFKSAKLAHARLTGATLTPLPLSDGRHRSVSFDGATLDGTGVILPG
jgi:uncharacterized protein YjbI with pentapeptide repeats